MNRLVVPFFAGVVAFAVAGCGQSPSGTYRLYAEFQDLQGLKVGDPVQLAGAQIGSVESIASECGAGTLRLTLAITRSAVVKTDSVAMIASSVARGGSFIVLDSGSPEAPVAVNGAILASRKLSPGPGTAKAKDAAMAMDTGCENLLKAYVGVPPDARDWAKRNPKTFTGGVSLEAMLTSLSDAGARAIVVLTNVPSHDYLLVLTLPPEAASRRKVFGCDARFREVCGLEPVQDCGQRYLGYPFQSKR